MAPQALPSSSNGLYGGIGVAQASGCRGASRAGNTVPPRVGRPCVS